MGPKPSHFVPTCIYANMAPLSSVFSMLLMEFTSAEICQTGAYWPIKKLSKIEQKLEIEIRVQNLLLKVFFVFRLHL